MTIRLEPRAKPLALAVAGLDGRCARRLPCDLGRDHRRRRWRPDRLVSAHPVDASFGSIGVLSDTLVKATPLILTGLACALAFRMRLWNIGAEGQFLLGAWGASAVVLFPLVPAGTPGIILIPLMMVAGMLAGAAVGADPGRAPGAPRA